MSAFLPGMKEHVRVPPRPNSRDPSIVAVVAQRLYDEAVRLGILEPGVEPEHHVADFVSVLEHAWDYDGYRLTVALESEHGWDGDEEVVDLMSGATCYIHEAVRDAVITWVARYEIGAPHRCGAAVTCRVGTETKIGEITRVFQDTAEYSLFCEQDGHTRAGPGTSGYIVPFESVITNA